MLKANTHPETRVACIRCSAVRVVKNDCVWSGGQDAYTAGSQGVTVGVQLFIFVKYPKCAFSCVFRPFLGFFLPANVLFQLFFKLTLTPLIQGIQYVT